METQPNTIEVRRNAGLAAVVGVVALAVAIGFLLRGGIGDIVVGIVALALAAGHLWTAWDARLPLLLVDEQGVRIRLSGTWRGLPWSQVHEIEHTPRPVGLRGVWHDGRLAVLPADESAELAELSGFARRWASLSQRLYGVPFSVPLGLSTTVVGAGDDLTETLARLAGPGTEIVEVDETLDPVDATPDTGHAAAHAAEGDMAHAAEGDMAHAAEGDIESPAEKTQISLRRLPADVPPVVAEPVAQAPEPVVEEPAVQEPVAPLRAVTRPVRVDISYDAPISPLHPEHTGSIPAIRDVDPIEDSGIVPAADPVIGPQLAASRERIGLSVDQLAERTRIRPHVIEAIEVDDFAPCGGDFYARGHLRTLARVLGLEAAPLLAEYDERYADAPVDPRAIFQAELASTGSARSLRRVNGGPNWSVLVAAVMAVVLVWSVARLVTAGGSSPSSSPAISLQAAGSGGSTNPYGTAAKPVVVTLNAAGGRAHVVVRDGSGKVVFNGNLAFGQSKALRVSPPMRVQSSDGSLEVAVDGQPAAAMGRTGQSTERTYTAS